MTLPKTQANQLIRLGETIDKQALLKKIAQLQAAKPDGYGPKETPTYRCQKCKDEEGYFVKVPHSSFANGEEIHYEMDVWKSCDCKENRRIERAFQSSRITFEFQKKSFDTFNLELLHESIRGAYHCSRNYTTSFQEFKSERQNSIALLGQSGSGKTHLLMAISNELMSSGKQKVLYFPWVEGFHEIKDDLSLTEERIQRMQQVDVLFIDDMFKGRKEPTSFQIEVAFAVINHRYMEKKPILISSERDVDQICGLDEALGSRIKEMCADFLVIIKGGRELNYRLREESDEFADRRRVRH